MKSNPRALTTQRLTSSRWLIAPLGFSRFLGTPAILLATALLAASLLPASLAAAAAQPKGQPDKGGATTQSVETVKFAVLSDLHFYDSRLGTEGDAFQDYLDGDPKLLALAEPILDAALSGVISENARFVVITGDLTKDGEMFNHVRVTQALQRLARAGIKAYVVPGNHDINNADAAKYDMKGEKPRPSADPDTFRDLYQRFGYGDAIDHAPDSLSYLAEPVPGLWLLLLDSVKWQDSAAAGYPVVGGRLTPQTMNWALGKLAAAAAAGKKVIAFMHHGVNPHFLAQPVFFPDYLLDEWGMAGYQLAIGGLKAVFTGHYHSLDAAWQVDVVGGQPQYIPGTLLDIQTPSLLSYPCAYRIAELASDGMLTVGTRRLTDIGVDFGAGVTLQDYALNFAWTLLPLQVRATLDAKFPGVLDSLPPDQAAGIVNLVVAAIIANYGGDEAPSMYMLTLITGLIASPVPEISTLGMALYSLWMDSAPGDATVSVDLTP